MAKYLVLFTLKKNGKLKLWINYRQLNSIIKKDRYLLLLISKIQNRIRNAQIFIHWENVRRLEFTWQVLWNQVLPITPIGGRWCSWHIWRSLRAACAIGVLDTELEHQLNRFFDFPVLLNFCLGSNSCPNNTIKK